MLLFRYLFLSFSIFLGLFISDVSAFQHLGVHGKTYPIVENDFYNWLILKVKEKEKGLKKFTNQDLQKLIEKGMIVNEFDDMPHCTKSSSKSIDLTYILDKNISDSNGNILYSKGTTVNPFNYVGLNKAYLFLDVDNITQINHYFMLAKESDNIQPMAVKGNLQRFYQISSNKGIPVPAGKASKLMLEKFQISCIPSLVTQKEKLINVESFDTEVMK
jgi:conjugal transfer pilus assembly protein TraW